MKRYLGFIVAAVSMLALLVLINRFANNYVNDQVEKRVRDTMLQCRAFHEYVQHDMHPAYYKLMDEGYLPKGFYAPEILSSSYIARNFQKHYNEERRKHGLPEVRYKLAAIDPRNPVNKASSIEANIITWFNEDKTRTSMRKIVKENGTNYLLLAQPFLPVEQRCLKCHGTPEEAPALLRKRYDWDGGWNRKVGAIVAAEFVRSPLQGEYSLATTLTGGGIGIFGFALTLLIFNGRLRKTVASRTQQLLENEQRLAHQNRILTAIRNINQIITHEKQATRLLDESCKMLVETSGLHSAYIVLTADKRPVGPFFHAGFNGEFASMTSRLQSGNLPKCAQEALGLGGVHVIKNPRHQCPECHLNGKFNDRSCLTLRLAHEDRVFGWLTIAMAREFAEQKEEHRLFEEVADDIGFALWTIDTETRRESTERKYAAVLETISDAVVATDMEGNITVFNPGAERLFELSAKQAVGTAFVRFCPEDLMQEHNALVQRLQHSSSVPAYETERLTVNGRRVSVEITLSLILDETGCRRGHNAILRDITERKRIEKSRAQLEQQLLQSQKMEAIGQLAGGVAHDFNNILTAFTLTLNLLRQEKDPSLGIQEGLAELEPLVQRASALTRQLLLFARREIMQRRVLDLNSLVANLLKMLSRLIGEHISLGYQNSQHSLWINADPGMIEQVITNLVVNARDAMPCGGRIDLHAQRIVVDSSCLEIHSQSRAGTFACLSIADSGCGMDEPTLKRIFEPFFTTKGVGKGTGLGLSTAYGIVQQHEGWIDVASTLDQGSTFRIFLPISETSIISTPVDEESHRLHGGKETILVVEDEMTLRNLIVRSLQRLGYRVLPASHGKEALGLWQEHECRIDLLLSDVVMPEGIGGFELAERLCQSQPELPVILMSGYNPELMSQGLAVPSRVTFVQKPFDPEGLLRKIRELLDQRKESA